MKQLTVKELINELQKFPKDSIVMLKQHEYGGRPGEFIPLWGKVELGDWNLQEVGGDPAWVFQEPKREDFIRDSEVDWQEYSEALEHWNNRFIPVLIW